MNTAAPTKFSFSPGKASVKPVYVFVALWLMMFLLYLPAVNGGWVSDSIEHLQKVIHGSFLDFINAKESRGNSYQFARSIDYLLYHLFGMNVWLWLMLFISLQAANATLLFVLCTKLFADSGAKHGITIAAGAVILFCICPHISEVMLWKAAYHYLQAMLILLCILLWVQKFQTTQLTRYAWYSAILFILSVLSDEFYFLTPLFVFTLIAYYRVALGYNKSVFKKSLLYFLLPVIIMLLLHILLISVSAGSYAADLGDEANQPLSGYLRKPPLYLFHIVFFGRFFSQDFRQHIYDLAVAKKGLVLVYGLFAALCIYIMVRFKYFKPGGKVTTLLATWMLFAMAMVCPVWFPDIQTVQFDRYTYFMLPFIYLITTFFLVQIKFRELAITIWTMYAFINIYFTLKENNDWRHSSHIINKLISDFPVAADNKIILLLNVPANMNGVPMVGPFLHFSFKQMYNLENVQQITNPVYEVVSYNMTGPGDGAHVMVINDSMLHVTLNQWATWWWYGMRGAFSYENEYYKVNMIDAGHWYELTLKHPAGQYLLLYLVGDKWKKIDWTLRCDQF